MSACIRSFLFIITFLAAINGRGQTITTLAGGIGEGLPAATYARLNIPRAVALDGAGNLYILDKGTGLIRKINSSGIITTFAGTGVAGGPGDGGPAINAYFTNPLDIAIDAAGNLYVTEYYKIRKINTSGIITTIAGGSTVGFSGDGGPAAIALLNNIRAIATDASGNIYVADNGRIRKINTSGVITTIAGGGALLSDGVPAIGASINVTGLTVDATGNVFIADGARIRMINTSGIITTVAGTGAGGHTGDGGPASAATLWPILGISIDPLGDMYICDGYYIRKINSLGIISTVAGNGSAGFSGDGGIATVAHLGGATNVVADGVGNVYIADPNNNRIRKVNVSGTISTYAGNALQFSGFGGDGSDARLALFQSICGLAVNNAGEVFATDNGNNRVRKINLSGTISTVAGSALVGFVGDGGPATDAALQKPRDVAFDASDNLYIADQATGHVRKVSPSGIITTIAGGGSSGIGDGGQATAAEVSVDAVAVDPAGNVYVADKLHNRIRKITPSGVISTIAGTGVAGYTGDGGPATNATLNAPTYVSVDRVGNVYSVDNMKLRKIDASGIITTITSFNSAAISADSMGNVYFVSGYAIWRVDIYGYVTLVAGENVIGFIGDGGPATAARLQTPLGVKIDRNGRLFIAHGTTIREVCCMNTIIDKPPVFVKGRSQNFTICKDAAAASIDTLMTITDGDLGDPIKCTVQSAPAHGTLAGFSYSTTSTGGVIKPSGFTYLPAPGYSGSDQFSILLSDGTDTFATTINVNIITPPNPGAIAGAASVCEGANITLFNGVAGGVWSNTNGFATISSAGVVTGVAAGIDTIVYTTTNMCGTTFTTKSVNVLPTTVVGSIKGPSNVCVGSSIMLSDSVVGGSWRSASPYLSVSYYSGVIIGNAPGTAVVYYTVSSTCGTAIDSTTITILPVPSAGVISGTTTLCTGGTVTLSDNVPGGIWSSGSTAIATVSSTGDVTGVAVGGAVISYTVTNGCGSASAITFVNIVSSLPILPVTGRSSICSGDTTTLHDATPGGTWSSSVTSVATITGSGVITAIAPGITAIQYTAALGCGSSVATFILKVDPAVSAGVLSGIPALCIGASTVLAASAPGGTWSTAHGYASVSTAGIVSGISTGADTVIYTVSNSCGSASVSHVLGVYPLPLPGIITGASTLCSGDSVQLSDAATGGAWTSSNISVATVGSTGIVKGMAGGTAIISYTVATGCGTAAAAKSISVNAAAGIITGVTTICTGTTSALSDAVVGGTWSSSNTTVATISSTGIVTGILAGTTIISYTVTAGCGLSATSAVVTIGTLPLVAAIAGSSVVCAGTTTLLSDVTPGGLWSSSNTAVAVVGSTGMVSGISLGTSVISYTVAAPCGSNTVAHTMQVETFPSAGVITGSTSLCEGAATSLSDNIPSGYWTSANTSLASIGSSNGIVNGILAGSVIMNYSVSNSCGTASTMAIMTVNPLPHAGSILGASDICVGASVTLSNATTGGAWTSSDVSVASIDPLTGILTGSTTGRLVIKYTTVNGCGSDTALLPIIVHALPVAGTISGFTDICVGSADTLKETLVSGTWSSGNTSIAAVGMMTGIVTGISPGSATILYNVTDICGTATTSKVIFVDSGEIAPVRGSSVLCMGSSVSFSDATPGGSWSSGNIAVATVDNSGIVSGIAPGSAVISYQVISACGTKVASAIVNVEQQPDAGVISADSTLCAGANAVLGESSVGGQWNSNNITLAVVSANGVITGIGAGDVIVSYTVTNSCGSASATEVITITESPYAGVIVGNTTICAGTVTMLSSTVGGGTWATASNSVAGINSAGELIARSSGTTAVSYTVSNSCGINTAFAPITVNQFPYIEAITGVRKAIVGGTTVLSNPIPGGAWSSGNTAIATVNARGSVFGVAAGTVVITYTVYNSSGCSSDSTATVAVFPRNARGDMYNIYPNPAGYEMTIGWRNEPDYNAEVIIMDMTGRRVYYNAIEMPNIDGSATINIATLVSGMYMVTVRSANGYYSGKLVVL